MIFWGRLLQWFWKAGLKFTFVHWDKLTSGWTAVQTSSAIPSDPAVCSCPVWGIQCTCVHLCTFPVCSVHLCSVEYSVGWIYREDLEWATEIEWERVEGWNGSRKNHHHRHNRHNHSQVSHHKNHPQSPSPLSLRVSASSSSSRWATGFVWGEVERLEEVKAGKRGWECSLLQPSANQYNTKQPT